MCLGALIPALAGCGSTPPPPFSLSCTTRVLASDQIRAAVDVINNTKTTGTAIIYGPIFANIQHIFPHDLAPTHVIVGNSTERGDYVAFEVQRVRAGKPSRLILRFLRPAHSESIAVTKSTNVRVNGSIEPSNPRCAIPRA